MTVVNRDGGPTLTEKQWQQVVTDYAKLRGWMVYHTLHSRGSEPGFPDLVMLRGNRQVVAELKTEKGRTTPAQEAWLAAYRLAGAEVHVWRPSDLQAVLSVLG